MNYISIWKKTDIEQLPPTKRYEEIVKELHGTLEVMFYSMLFWFCFWQVEMRLMAHAKAYNMDSSLEVFCSVLSEYCFQIVLV